MTAEPQAEMGSGPAARPPIGKLVRKLVIELGPLIGFFVIYNLIGILWATAVFMALTALAIVPSWWRHGRPPPVPMVSLAVVLVMGGLTLLLEDERFITARPTVINLLFAGALLWGQWTGRPLLERGFGDALSLTHEGWRGLTFRLAAFLVSLAVLNELVRHTQPLDVWVAFKTFAVIPLDLAFFAAMWPYVRRHQAPPAG